MKTKYHIVETSLKIS